MMERAEILDRLWDSAEKVLFIPKVAFVKNLEDWDIKTVEVDGTPAFVTLQRGAHFHFESLGTGHAITREMIWNFLRPIIAQHGYAATKTPHHDERQHRFNRAFGFQVVGSDEYDIHYRIDRVRGAQCQ